MAEFPSLPLQTDPYLLSVMGQLRQLIYRYLATRGPPPAAHHTDRAATADATTQHLIELIEDIHNCGHILQFRTRLNKP
jgi:hypothetical protein